MKNTTVFSIFIICLSLIAILYIRSSNDHTDCTVTTTTKVSEDGLTKVTTTKHSCHDNHNL
ncbi:hypothetical protein [Psychroserpens sp.]|uniref:hypothetical protein n=1 Tax=Psychroserpens sp. TaxID=2020870 RepID=UPI00385AE5D4